VHAPRHNHHTNEQGFTLIELLVVILVIGVLAAISLPAFLGQRDKARDATAKSLARNMVSQIEACFRNTDGFVGCTAELSPGVTGLPTGPNPGQVSIVTETATGYIITAVSEATGGGANHTFTIVHNVGGVMGRTCTVAGKGGCPPGGTW
jgi:type IV pilus assembly protein PilA